ncbi:MAG: cupin domain-containing protein [Bacteroidota bacterium]
MAFLLVHVAVTGQDVEIIKPILLDRSVLSGLGLKKIEIKNEPEKDFYQKRLYRGDDLSVYVVSTETWINEMDNFPFDEFVHMYHGEAVVTPEQGSAQLFYSGDSFFAPRGFTGNWEIRAGDYLHYELSVIASQRADPENVSQNGRHLLFDRSTLSGAHIKLDEQGRYSELLHAGVELTFRLEAESPQEVKIVKPNKERMIQVLSGLLTLTDLSGDSVIGNSGDFIMVPAGFTGTWKSEGHSIIKYLSIERTHSDTDD